MGSFSIPWNCPDCGCGGASCYKYEFVYDASDDPTWQYTGPEDDPESSGIWIGFFAYSPETRTSYDDTDTDFYYYSVSGSYVSGWFITHGALMDPTQVTINYMTKGGSFRYSYALITSTTRVACPDA